MAPGPRPSPLLGEDRSEPGYWAQMGMDTPWIADRAMRQYQGILLAELLKRTPRREPGTRLAKKRVDGEKFYNFIGANIASIEALVAQTVGEVKKDECEKCAAGDGPFTSCVSVPRLRHLMPCCANCHFSLKGRTPTPDDVIELRESNDRILRSLREARYDREHSQREYDRALADLLAADRRMGEVLDELESLWLGLESSDSDLGSDSE